MFGLLYKVSRKSRIVNIFLRFVYKCDIPVTAKIGKMSRSTIKAWALLSIPIL